MVEFDRSAFIGKFQEEAQDLLQRLNEGVITLEGESDSRELIDQMLRDAHTLKGSSRMVGLIDISNVAHRLEDIMVKIRDGGMAYTSDLSDIFFEALDAIVYLTDIAGKDVEIEIDTEALQVKMTAIAENGKPAGEESAEQPAQAPKKATTRAKAARKTKAETAETSGTGNQAEPEGDSSPDDASGEDDADRDDILQDGDETTEDRAADGPQRAKRDDNLQAKVQHTIRIKTSQVDTLLNLVSEVVISQIKAEQRSVELRTAVVDVGEIWQAWVRLKSALSGMPDSDGLLATMQAEITELDDSLADWRRTLGEFIKGYAEDVSRTTVVVNDLQEHGMRLRMLPVNTIFQTFPRAVRDLAKQFRKEIDLVLEGGDTELDKKVLEEINDPLVHIIRNAVDHGLEPPEERVKLGKPPKGTIRMSARQEGDHILIEVSDDGAGIDPDKVRASAVRKGYMTQTEADAMTDREATYLIFEAGFSTSAIITEISGRGVGMDVVREFIVEKLKGSLDIDSEMGRGTTFRLTIPLTLAIIRALMLRVGNRAFALPTTSIEETLRVNPAEIIKVEGREVIRRQRRTIPLVRLADILGVPSNPSEEGAKVPIAVVGFSGHRMGFLVDSFVGEQQIVIKPLGTHLRKIDNVAGVTILGAGEVVPILNVPDLMQNARHRTGQRTGPSPKQDRTGPKAILICEDSFTTRELERSIFEAAGYQVEVAMDGLMGLNKLKEGLKVDAVVTDVQMPNMTGFELTRAIKSDPGLMAVPVIIVTSLERDEEKAEGIDAGADAYITKSVFNQDTLLDTVEQLIR